MEAVRYLHGFWGRLPDGIGVDGGAVPGNEFGTWVLPKPRLDCASLPIGQQIHRPAGRQVNQDRAVTLPFAEGEVIDAQCLRGSPQPGRVPGLLEAVKQSVRAQEQAEGAGNAGGGLSTNQPVQLLQGIGQARRLASIAPSNTGNRLGEDTPGAIWVVAEELAAGQFNPHGIFRPGQVWSVRG